MIEKISLACYRLTLIPDNEIIMPQWNKGNILRGAFGSSLKKLVCALPRGDNTTICAECLQMDKCAYSLLFNPVGLNPAKRLKTPPRGYVLKPPLEEKTHYFKDAPLKFIIILVGDRINFLPYLIVSLRELGRWGIGVNRGKFVLGEMEIFKDGFWKSIYDRSSNTVSNLGASILGQELIRKAKDLDAQKIVLQFLTPTRIKYNPTGEKGKSQIVQIPEFHHLIRRLRDRINALSVTYCGGPLHINFQKIAEKALSIKTIRANLRWVERKRKGVHDQSGFVGEIRYQGDIKEFLPLLVLGEYLHVGEDAVFGNGWYRIKESQHVV